MSISLTERYCVYVLASPCLYSLSDVVHAPRIGIADQIIRSEILASS
jgi:hypothetical protein